MSPVVSASSARPSPPTVAALQSRFRELYPKHHAPADRLLNVCHSKYPKVPDKILLTLLGRTSATRYAQGSYGDLQRSVLKQAKKYQKKMVDAEQALLNHIPDDPGRRPAVMAYYVDRLQEHATTADGLNGSWPEQMHRYFAQGDIEYLAAQGQLDHDIADSIARVDSTIYLGAFYFTYYRLGLEPSSLRIDAIIKSAQACEGFKGSGADLYNRFFGLCWQNIKAASSMQPRPTEPDHQPDRPDLSIVQNVVTAAVDRNVAEATLDDVWNSICTTFPHLKEQRHNLLTAIARQWYQHRHRYRRDPKSEDIRAMVEHHTAAQIKAYLTLEAHKAFGSWFSRNPILKRLSSECIAYLLAPYANQTTVELNVVQEIQRGVPFVLEACLKGDVYWSFQLLAVVTGMREQLDTLYTFTSRSQRERDWVILAYAKRIRTGDIKPGQVWSKLLEALS